LNKGINFAKGKYVARMDHDDISLRERLSNQVEFMESHPEVAILGTWAKTFGNRAEVWRYPASDAEIKTAMLFHSVLVHSSVMFRRSSFAKHRLAYDNQTKRAQDYELWVRASKHLQFANLEQILLHYRLHPGQMGGKFGAQQQAVAERMRLRQLARLGLKPNRREAQLHHAISRWQFPRSAKGLREVESWLLKIQKQNHLRRIFSQPALQDVLEQRWWAGCRSALSLGSDSWRLYRASALAGGRGLVEQARFWAKATVSAR
jgi:glycosyltransferase involved in cell wall biosynthesis